jgi:hypothetical protein
LLEELRFPSVLSVSAKLTVHSSGVLAHRPYWARPAGACAVAEAARSKEGRGSTLRQSSPDQ